MTAALLAVAVELLVLLLALPMPVRMIAGTAEEGGVDGTREVSVVAGMYG